ncbi:hypothetical protein AB1L88_25225 [Tautonia sp. JC769]|uniref:hypothetical protein n=1 Tax=Tautonia sp. JC769 TaxID=3232135 RepID=UPI00345A0766
MATKHNKTGTCPAASVPASSSPEVPWQIWVTVVLLGLEGVGNLLSIPREPAAAIWLAAKCLFIVGLIRGWRWVFILFLVVAGLHVLAFSTQAPFLAFLNLVILLLVGSALRFFFPRDHRRRPEFEAISPAPGLFDRSLDA